jgi:hypothetical protein
MEALRASCMMISSEFEWRVGVGLADACLPLHGLRSVQIRFKGSSIQARQFPLHSLAHRSATNSAPSSPLTAIIDSVRQTVHVPQA